VLGVVVVSRDLPMSRAFSGQPFFFADIRNIA